MHGMFGAMPMPGPALPSKKRSTGTSSKRSEVHVPEDVSPTARAPPVPMIPLPGMSRVRSPEEVDKQLEYEEATSPITSARPANEVPDVEDVVASRERSAPAPPGMSILPNIFQQLKFLQCHLAKEEPRRYLQEDQHLPLCQKIVRS